MAAGSITSITDKITKDGSSGYKAEKGRYHLYVSHGCPFANRWGINCYLIQSRFKSQLFGVHVFSAFFRK